MSKDLLHDLETSEDVPEDQIIQVLLDAIFEATVQIHEAAECIQASSEQAFKAMGELEALLEKKNLRHPDVEESMKALADFLYHAEQAVRDFKSTSGIEVEDARSVMDNSMNDDGSVFLTGNSSKRMQCGRNMSYEERHALIHGISEDDFKANGLRNRGVMQRWRANLGL